MLKKEKGGDQTRQKNLNNTEKPSSESRRKPILNIILGIISYLVWSGTIVIALQFLISIIFTSIFHNNIDSPIIFAVYSLFYYGLSVFVIVFLPQKLSKKIQKRNPVLV